MPPAPDVGFTANLGPPEPESALAELGTLVGKGTSAAVVEVTSATVVVDLDDDADFRPQPPRRRTAASPQTDIRR